MTPRHVPSGTRLSTPSAFVPLHLISGITPKYKPVNPAPRLLDFAIAVLGTTLILISGVFACFLVDCSTLDDAVTWTILFCIWAALPALVLVLILAAVLTAVLPPIAGSRRLIPTIIYGLGGAILAGALGASIGSAYHYSCQIHF